jgi:hypothetical protein
MISCVIANFFFKKDEGRVKIYIPLHCIKNTNKRIMYKLLPFAGTLLVMMVLLSSCKKEKSFVVDKSLKCNHPHNIKGVWSYKDVFCDENDVQMQMAKYKGIKPISDRKQAEKMEEKLSHLMENKMWGIDSLYHSIPYLIPTAKESLDSIGVAFMDSLRSKGLNPYRVVVTSVLRTKEDVIILRKHNKNAIANSAHSYGTTYDVSWKRFRKVGDPNGRPLQNVSKDTLKLVLSEVLRDMRARRIVYVKYERRQGCFHVTSRL